MAARRRKKVTDGGKASVRIGGTVVTATVLGTDKETGQVQVSWPGGRAWVAPGDVTRAPATEKNPDDDKASDDDKAGDE